MSTSLLYHAWGLKGYRYVRSHYGGGKLIFTVKPNPRSLTCPVCHCRDILLHGSTYRMGREVSIGSQDGPTGLQYVEARQRLRRCGTETI
jgi:transposase